MRDRDWSNWLDRPVTASTAQGMPHGKGRVVAYVAAPTFLIETEDGERFSWRCDLTDVTERRSGEDRRRGR